MKLLLSALLPISAPPLRPELKRGTPRREAEAAISLFPVGLQREITSTAPSAQPMSSLLPEYTAPPFSTSPSWKGAASSTVTARSAITQRDGCATLEARTRLTLSKSEASGSTSSSFGDFLRVRDALGLRGPANCPLLEMLERRDERTRAEQTRDRR